MQNTKTIKSVYIHIPFCHNICSYCDFCKNYYNEKIVEDYLNALEKEINNNYKNEIINTLYIGGGTPSSLSIKQLKKLFSIIDIFKLNKEYEFTFECNYEDINEDMLMLLKQNKVNRLSIGIQTFNKKFEKILERNIDKEKMYESILLSKKYFNNINVDLMYAIGDENLKDLEEDINEFIKLDVTHISTYALIIEDNTKLKISNIKEINEDTQNEMYELICKKLKENNYVHYELSNFSKKGYESKHNLTYWNNENYYGFGAGASGFIKNTRYDNTKSVINYINGKTIVFEEKLTKEDLINDEVMLNLRKITGINKKEFYNKYKINFNEVFNIDNLIKQELLIENEEYIYINPKYLFISNEIIYKIIYESHLE